MGDLLPLGQGARALEDREQHSLKIVADIGIGKSQNEIALVRKVEVAVPIFDRIMAVVINFHDKPD